MAQVYLPRSLLTLFPNAERRPVVDAATVDELIERLDARWPGMRARLCDAGPTLREHINVFVDGERAVLGDAARGHVGRARHPGRVSGGGPDAAASPQPAGVNASTDQIGGR